MARTESKRWGWGRPSRSTSDLVIVANRLPIEHDPGSGWRRAPGGLVSAMEAVLRDREVLWVGWSGQLTDAQSDAKQPDVPADVGSIELASVPLTKAQVNAYYDGFSNGALWPLYHGSIVSPVYHRSQFDSYREVNELFADAVAERAADNARVWVHDYQLQLVPGMLRARRPDLRIGFFLHIPFPPIELFSQLPWRAEVVEGLLGSDVIGFQTADAATNFARLAGRLVGATEGEGAVFVDAAEGTRKVVVKAFPIGIRANDYAGLAAQPAVRERAKQIRADVGNPETLLLGVDRLDYTKGIDVRVRAVTELMIDGDLDPETTAFVQVATPTRERMEEYQKIRSEVELLVSRANGFLGKVGTNPIHYMHQTFPPDELVALYLAADLLLVTPLRDGMNLVAKEYVASRIHNKGALVLSEFTGAAEQMTEAWLVNPYDIGGTKRTILAALHEPETEAMARMAMLRAGVFRDDVAAWATSFLDSFPEVASDDA